MWFGEELGVTVLLFLWVWFREELTGNYERAAAIAVFQGRIRRGIASLKDGAGVAQQQGDAIKGRYSRNLKLNFFCVIWAFSAILCTR